MINGLYVSCYYSGGVFGSFLPGLLSIGRLERLQPSDACAIATLAFLVG